MALRKANEAEFFFLCGGFSEETFLVASYKGTERISEPYSFTIELTSVNQDIDPDDIIGSRASLFVYRNEEYYPYSGIVSEFHVVDRTKDRAAYSVTLVPRLWLLSLNVQTRIFQNLSCREIVKQVITDANLGDCCEFKWKESDSKENEFVVQYNESDLNFITRLMEREGTRYLFIEPPLVAEEMDGEPSAERVLFCDSDCGFTDIDGEALLRYRSWSGLHEVADEDHEEYVARVELSARAISRETFCRTYNYRTPEVAINAQREVEGGTAGSVYTFGGSAKNTDEVTGQARLAANRLQSQRTTMGGRGNCRGLRAARRFTLFEHPRADFNTGHIVTEVFHNGSQNSGGGDAARISYANTFTTVAAALGSIWCPPERAGKPSVPGVLTATIESNGGDYALLDEKGRYKVRLPFDISGAANAEASKFVRLSSPYAGSNYGMHFPSHEGTEMVVSFVNGDPDKILGLATVPNANTASPVTSSNKEQSVVRTAGGNELLMDDLDGEQRIRLMTHAAHAVELDDGKRRVVIQSTDGNKVLLDDENERCDFNAGDQTIVLSYQSGQEGITITTGKGHVIRLDDKGKKLTIQTEAGNILQMDDGGKKIVMSDANGKGTVTLDGNKGITLDTSGKIVINASQDVEIKGANVKIATGTGGNIEGKASMGKVSFEGKDFAARASLGDVTLDGQMNVAIKGGMSVKADGSMGMSKMELGATGAKVSGLMAELSGTAMTTVKGAVVMIN